ncbi:hypothetical protein P168DRAFT_278855 [Aspergillus campestris IBT 28561]|uniref:Uncharacterized protein n=1 Tax=Aspergillus campestris (strain IBT 28561) TaxID=1392248 RepID=A0A2I1DHL4_ASPC2|nr:uncharacterized protein P168DRAFT_278855 [Aspergillus campestris IBT 28561]PKY09365.1 hypothetical protein P168DRAFT_278855 [Aspergillus campestris IBT 28561]
MPSLRASLLLLIAATSTAVNGERLKVVWSSGSFSTVSGPAGNESGNYNGFAIFDEAGKAIYDQGTPDNHSPCYSTDDGREFTIEGDCWDTPRKFKCKSNLAGNPQTCEVKDGNGNSLGKGDGKTDTTFIGIAIGMDSSCVVEFDADSHNCPEDDGNGPLHVTSG